MHLKSILPLFMTAALVAPVLASPAPSTDTAVVPGTAAAAPASAAAPAPAAPTAPARPALSTERDLISYSVGVQTGRALRTADGAEVNMDAMVQGLKDGLDGVKLQLPERQMTELLGRFQQTLRQKMQASRGRAKVANAEAAAKFLEENKKKPDIVTLDSGVQYRIITTGNGKMPNEGDAVTVNYRGTLLNGNEFDATEPGRPARLTVGSLIAGWKQVLKQMPVGSHWQIFVPPQLGYGERGVGAEIGPNELLTFDLELLATQPAQSDR